MHAESRLARGLEVLYLAGVVPPLAAGGDCTGAGCGCWKPRPLSNSSVCQAPPWLPAIFFCLSETINLLSKRYLRYSTLSLQCSLSLVSQPFRLSSSSTKLSAMSTRTTMILFLVQKICWPNTCAGWLAAVRYQTANSCTKSSLSEVRRSTTDLACIQQQRQQQQNVDRARDTTPVYAQKHNDVVMNLAVVFRYHLGFRCHYNFIACFESAASVSTCKLQLYVCR